MGHNKLASDTGFALMPSHPGRTLRHELEARGMTANAFAMRIRVPANRLTDIINGKRGITVDTALRLDEALGVSARFWLTRQVEYELAIGERESRARIHAEVA
jgi:addiction module HigA family antidote